MLGLRYMNRVLRYTRMKFELLWLRILSSETRLRMNYRKNSERYKLGNLKLENEKPKRFLFVTQDSTALL